LSATLQKRQKSQRSDSERVRDFQRNLYQKAKREPSFRFYVLYDKIRLPQFLREAYKRVKANGGASGIDGVTFAEIEDYGTAKYLSEISVELKNESYRPSPVKRVFIPKANGEKRPLGIPTIKDRIVQMSCKLVIEPIYESDFEESSYGFRPKRSSKGAITEIRNNLKQGKTEVFDADISKYFDTIPHDKLLIVVAKRISDRKVIHLIKMWLKSPVHEDGKISGGKKNKVGTPQGGVISPLLANIYLHLLDRLVNTKAMFKQLGIEIIRYADDFILMGNQIPDNILEYVTHILERMGLKLNTEKSRKVQAKEESFNFLGFTFRYDRGQNNWRLRYWHIEPSMKSQKKMRGNMKEYFRKNRYKAMPEFSPGLNAILRGWMNYYHIPKVSYCRKTFNRMKWHLDVSLWNHYNKKSQKVSKLYRRYGFDGMVKKYGLIDPTKYIYQHKLVKA
jgi:RNA-directed DNA polymerase